MDSIINLKGKKGIVVGIANDKSIEFKINKLYLNLFNRKADFDGLNYWLAMVKNENHK